MGKRLKSKPKPRQKAKPKKEKGELPDFVAGGFNKRKKWSAAQLLFALEMDMITGRTKTQEKEWEEYKKEISDATKEVSKAWLYTISLDAYRALERHNKNNV